MSIQDEIQSVIKKINIKLAKENKISEAEMRDLFLLSIIEEEGDYVPK